MEPNVERNDRNVRMNLVLRWELPDPLWDGLKKLTVRGRKPAGAACEDDRRRTIGLWSAPFSTSCAPVFRGVTCRRTSAHGLRCIHGFGVGAPRVFLLGCSRSCRLPQKASFVTLTARISSCTKTERIRAAARPHRLSVARKGGSTRSWRQSWTVKDEPLRSAWQLDSVTICMPSSPFCPACAGIEPSQTRASMPTHSARGCADSTNPRGGRATQPIGPTKGGINTKLAEIVDGQGRAVALGLAAGQRHDLYAERN